VAYYFTLKEVGMALKVGELAPDFALESQLGSIVRLSDYLGRKNVALIFFPLAWTPV
jgi:mycoredoxin-dependent peroxiredoxin